MNITLLKEFFLFCTLINMVVLMIWFFMFTLASNLVYRYHSKWFKISFEEFHIIHYKFMGFYKILIFIFNLVPYIALLTIE
jgi:hypothetical protein